jgi:PST family polysaccharide transporter
MAASVSRQPGDARTHSMLRALGWTALGRWTAQSLTWLTTLYVARLLSPVDYGIVGMATFVFGAIGLVSEFGLGAAAITAPMLGTSRARQLNTVSLYLGMIGTVVMLLLAVPVSRFFAEPRVAEVLAALSGSLFFSAAKAVPDGLLQRQGRFRAVAVVDLLRVSVQSGTTLALALIGSGYWSLTAGMVAGPAAAAVLTSQLAWPGVEKISRKTGRETLSFSLDIVGSRLAWYWYSNADFVVAGRVLGTAALGLYSLAWMIANIPIDRIGNVVAKVALPFFSHAQHDVTTLRADLLKLSEGLAAITIPACIGLALVADDLVELVLGAKWAQAVLPLQILCLYAPIRVLLLLFPLALMALGKQRFLFWSNLGAAVVLPCGFWIASRWGTEGIAAAWVALYPCVAVPQCLSLSRIIDLRFLNYLQALKPALVSSGIMAAAVLTMRSNMPLLPVSAVLAVEAGAGAVAYSLSFFILFRGRLMLLRGLAQTFRSSPL